MPKYDLMEHQRKGVDFLDEVDGIGALLFDPGVGKTGTTLAWIDRMADRLGEFRVLVVAPLTAADTWVLQPSDFMDSPVKARMLMGSTESILNKIRAAGTWTGVPDSKIEVNHNGTLDKQVSGNRVTILSMSAGAISSYCRDRTRTVKVLQALRKYKPHLIVVDESHIIKAPNANLSKALYQMGQMVDHRIILTGTVTPHSSLDVYGQWRFMAPWTFSDSYGETFTLEPLRMTRDQKASIRPWAWGRFTDRYAEKGGYKGKAITGVNEYTKGELWDRVAERAMVVRKKDALDLPPTADLDIHVSLSAAEARAYQEMHDELVAEMADGSLLEAPNPLAKIMKLRQITSGFAHDTDSGETHIIGTSKQKAMAEIVNTQLASKNRIVVCEYFRRACFNLAETLAKAPENKGAVIEVITGATKPSERLAIRKRFGNTSAHPERIILIAQVTTMALSVNELVTAQDCVFGSYTNQRAHWQQFRDRLDRKGQTLPVTFWNVFVPGSIDEVMLENHHERGDMEAALLNHVMGAPRAPKAG